MSQQSSFVVFRSCRNSASDYPQSSGSNSTYAAAHSVSRNTQRAQSLNVSFQRTEKNEPTPTAFISLKKKKKGTRVRVAAD